MCKNLQFRWKFIFPIWSLAHIWLNANRALKLVAIREFLFRPKKSLHINGSLSIKYPLQESFCQRKVFSEKWHFQATTGYQNCINTCPFCKDLCPNFLQSKIQKRLQNLWIHCGKIYQKRQNKMILRTSNTAKSNGLLVTLLYIFVQLLVKYFSHFHTQCRNAFKQ